MSGFVFKPTEDDEWVAGQGKATERFGGALNPTGQWLQWVPKGENQRRGTVETMGCTIYHSLNAWETLARFLGYKDFPQNCSERYSGVLAGVSPQGNDPHTSCEAIRRFGVIPEEVLPFSENIHDWVEFYSPKPMTEDFLALGKKIVEKYTLGHQYVFNGTVPMKGRVELLKEYLTRGPVCVSVYAWRLKDGLYYKEENQADTHWVHLVGYVDGKYWLVRDSYAPYDKKVAWDTAFQTAKVYFLKPNQNGVAPLDSELLDLLTRLLLKAKKWLTSLRGFVLSSNR